MLLGVYWEQFIIWFGGAVRCSSRALYVHVFSTLTSRGHFIYISRMMSLLHSLVVPATQARGGVL